MDAPRIELLWWAGCPSWERALALLRERVSAAGLDPECIVVSEIVSAEQARRLGFPGSPTIRVDGADVQEPEAQATGLACRVYRTREGRVSPLPGADAIDAALGARVK